MPKMSGPTIAESIRNDPVISKTKVVMIGSTDGAALHTAKVDGWLAKPVRPSRLFNCIHQLFARTEGLSDSAPADASSGEGGAVYEERRKERRILVVEDNLVNQAVVARQLEALGFTATIVDDAQQGMEALARAPFDAVLLDCELPGMDGYTAAKEIRRREGDSRHTIIIALTAHAITGQRQKCLDAGWTTTLASACEWAHSRRPWIDGPHLKATRRAPRKAKEVAPCSLRSHLVVRVDRILEVLRCEAGEAGVRRHSARDRLREAERAESEATRLG
jgi:CheY-like chemotaxis protein